jgi:hypothetical protein
MTPPCQAHSAKTWRAPCARPSLDSPAITIALVGSLLAFLNVSPEYQSGVQGAILIVVLAGRALARRDKQ